MAMNSNSTEDADIDLGGLFVAIWRRRVFVLTTTVALGALAFIGAKLVSPKYQGETQVLIETRAPDLARRSTDQSQSDTSPDEAGVASQVALLQSVDLIKQVAKDFKLYERPEFDPSANPSLLTRVLVMSGLMKNPLDVPPEDRVIKEFTQHLQVYQVEKSRVVAIQFSSKDPKLVAEIPNAMANVYLSLQSGAKLSTTSETARWLEPEIANLREKVQEAEAKVAAYRSSSDLFRTGQQNTLSEQQLTDLSQELARVRGDKATAEARAQSIRAALNSGRNVDTVNEVVNSQMIQRLKETQSGIEGQIADLSTQLLDGHPRLKGLRSQLEGIREQIRVETKKILSSLENEAGVAALREKQLMAQLNSLKADSANKEEKQVGLNALDREATAQRQLLETYLARYREAMSQQDMNATPADARIVSRATMPTEPYFPKILPITVVALLAGFILSSVIVMLSELFSGRAIRRVEYDVVDEQDDIIDAPAVREPSRASAVVRKSAAGNIHEPARTPASLLSIEPAEMDVAADGAEPDEETDECRQDDVIEPEFSIEAVAGHLVDNDVGIAVSVSLNGDEGSAATVAVCRKVAEMGRKTILIDMTGSALPTQLMSESLVLPGITDLLTGEAAFGETIHADKYSDAHILPQGTADAKRAMRGADRLSMIISALANAYDLVLVECGAADVGGVSRLARQGETEIILSAAGASAEDIEAVAGSFIENGYDDVVLLLGEAGRGPTSSDRKAA